MEQQQQQKTFENYPKFAGFVMPLTEWKKTRREIYLECKMMTLGLDLLCLKTMWNTDTKMSEFRGNEWIFLNINPDFLQINKNRCSSNSLLGFVALNDT